MHRPLAGSRQSKHRVCASASSLFWRYLLDGGRVALVRREIDRLVLHGLARRVVAKVVAAFPVALRADRPWREIAAAVGADVAEQLGTRCTERAFEAADTRIERLRRQRLIAVFAGRSQFEHQSAFTKSYFPTPWISRKRHGARPGFET